MVQIVAFKKEHGLDVRIMEVLKERGFDPTPELFADLEAGGTAFAMVQEETVLGCGGILLHWEGVGEAWTALTDAAKDMPFILHRAVKIRFKEIADRYKLHRVQSLVRINYPAGARWMEELGFFKEGTRYQYGSDRTTYHCYVWLRYA